MSLIVSDDFTSGSMASFWGSQTSTSIVSAAVGGRSASNVLDFFFEGGATGQDSFSEARFDLGVIYPEIGIVFDLYIPPNYNHRSDSPNNNKLFRLWTADYGENEKVGGSMRSEGGYSSAGLDYRVAPGGGMHTTEGGATSSFITASDKDTWVEITLNARAATSEVDGVLEIRKNGVSFVNHVMTNAFDAQHGYRYGYLLGWANSGHTEDTYFKVDNARFYDQMQSGTPADITDPAATISSPTSNLTYATGLNSINLSGTSSDDTAVTRVDWSNDRGGSGTTTGTTSWSQSNITLYSGVNVLTITAYDAANSATDTLTVTYTPPDTTKPVITLLGSTPVNVTVDTSYTDAGATALDDIDGDITGNISTVNPVNINLIGQYVVTYNVSDAANNAADEVTRTVNVVAAEPAPQPAQNRTVNKRQLSMSIMFHMFR